jgi:hypothetical protein
MVSWNTMRVIGQLVLQVIDSVAETSETLYASRVFIVYLVMVLVTFAVFISYNPISRFCNLGMSF